MEWYPFLLFVQCSLYKTICVGLKSDVMWYHIVTKVLLEQQHWRCPTPRLNTHAQVGLDLHMLPNLILNWTTYVDRSPDVWGQPMSKNYTCLRGLHHLTSEEMYVLEWKRRNRKQTQPTHYTTRFQQRDAWRENASLASYDLLTSLQKSSTAVNGNTGRTWHHTTALSTWMKV